MKELEQAIAKRRTFAIISHPDAGKTTLTEKFLLFGGAIQTAGAVKSNKIKKSATSDFMEIERQRGISVATSVMTFEYADLLINLLDTPGHKDFAEDTYRTLTAVDSVVLVIDCVKGVEAQTERLMEVCRMRDTPVLIFINKLDRDGRDPFDLLDELEEKLSIKVRPLTWPSGMGKTFQGVYDLEENSFNIFRPGSTKVEETQKVEGIDSEDLKSALGENHWQTLKDEVDLIQGVYDDVDVEAYRAGKLAPVCFGSAINNFGVQELLDAFCRLSPPPAERPASTRDVQPEEDKFSGFIFKIHANIDPKHRDRIAFMRICSGCFERNTFYHHVRLNKNVRFHNPYAFMARSKEVVDQAWPGDVIGLYDTGNLKIGDAITTGENLTFKGIPSFSPEIFREVINRDPMKSKQLDKGIRQLTEEGVAQLFIKEPGSKKIVGCVGELQFDVIRYRLEHEYGAKCEFFHLPYFKACWLTSEDESKISEFRRYKSDHIVEDRDGNPVFLAESAWILDVSQQNYPEIQFHTNSEFKTVSEAG